MPWHKRGGAVWGVGVSISYYKRGQKRQNLKNPDHLSLIDTHQSEVSSGYSTAYSHTALRAWSLKSNGWVDKYGKRMGEMEAVRVLKHKQINDQSRGTWKCAEHASYSSGVGEVSGGACRVVGQV